ncbi:hypothetical protein EAG_01540 [Camponotus floridanus]|uniref:Uncharacterized protein n=1 Tax=Camponotus floridanus TaxID=104421 RepID=E2AVS8_CAMFO|nr:hypothetical protein EAG_01540 [Camponotus floridanus]
MSSGHCDSVSCSSNSLTEDTFRVDAPPLSVLDLDWLEIPKFTIEIDTTAHFVLGQNQSFDNTLELSEAPTFETGKDVVLLAFSDALAAQLEFPNHHFSGICCSCFLPFSGVTVEIHTISRRKPFSLLRFTRGKRENDELGSEMRSADDYQSNKTFAASS